MDSIRIAFGEFGIGDNRALLERGRRCVCVCCEDGFYCRHRCEMHPKLNGLADSGKPWRDR